MSKTERYYLGRGKGLTEDNKPASPMVKVVDEAISVTEAASAAALINDITTNRELLIGILIELRKLNTYMSIITDQEVYDRDIGHEEEIR